VGGGPPPIEKNIERKRRRGGKQRNIRQGWVWGGNTSIKSWRQQKDHEEGQRGGYSPTGTAKGEPTPLAGGKGTNLGHKNLSGGRSKKWKTA